MTPLRSPCVFGAFSRLVQLGSRWVHVGSAGFSWVQLGSAVAVLLMLVLFGVPVRQGGVGSGRSRNSVHCGGAHPRGSARAPAPRSALVRGARPRARVFLSGRGVRARRAGRFRRALGGGRADCRRVRPSPSPRPRAGVSRCTAKPQRTIRWTRGTSTARRAASPCARRWASRLSTVLAPTASVDATREPHRPLVRAPWATSRASGSTPGAWRGWWWSRGGKTVRGGGWGRVGGLEVSLQARPSGEPRPLARAEGSQADCGLKCEPTGAPPARREASFVQISRAYLVWNPLRAA